MNRKIVYVIEYIYSITYSVFKNLIKKKKSPTMLWRVTVFHDNEAYGQLDSQCFFIIFLVGW